MKVMGFLIVIILVVLIFASLPHWPYTKDRGLGYYPGSILGLLLLILLIFLFLRVIPWGWPGAYPY